MILRDSSLAFSGALGALVGYIPGSELRCIHHELRLSTSELRCGLMVAPRPPRHEPANKVELLLDIHSYASGVQPRTAETPLQRLVRLSRCGAMWLQQCYTSRNRSVRSRS